MEGMGGNMFSLLLTQVVVIGVVMILLSMVSTIVRDAFDYEEWVFGWGVLLGIGLPILVGAFRISMRIWG